MKKVFNSGWILILASILLLAGCQTPATTSLTETVTVTATETPSTTTTQVTETSPSPSTTPAITSKTYYVKNGGNDSASGLSDAEAWETLSKVQNFHFNPGDTILLKCGSTWDERLDFPSSGNSSSDILLSSYGVGEQPKMMRLQFFGKEHITISNIHMLADSKYQALLAGYCHDITIDGITADGQKIMNVHRDRYLEVTAFYYSYNVTIKNSTIKDGGDYYGNSDYGGGIGIDDGNHDFLVENNLIYNHAGFGIQTGPWDDTTPAYNITIRGNTIYNEEGYHDDCRGINIGWDSYDIIVEKNTVSNMKTMLIGTDADEHDVIIRNNLLFYTLDDGYATFIDILSTSTGEHYNSFVYNNSMFHLSHIAEGTFIDISTVDSIPNRGHKIFNNLCVTYNPDVTFIRDQSWDTGNPNPLRSEFTSDYNLFYSMVPSGAFIYRNVKYDNIDDWREVSGQDMHSIYGNPLLNGIENYDDSIAFTTTGNELISNPSFDYNTNGWACWFDTAGGASGSISRTSATGEYATSPGGLKVTCNTGGNIFASIQLHNSVGMSIEANKWYILSFKAKANSQFRVQDIGFMQMLSPYTEYYTRKLGDNPIITTDWKTYQLFVYTNQDASDAKITWYLGNSLPAGGTFYLDDVSFKLADGLNNIVLPDIEDFVTPSSSPCVDAGMALDDVIYDILGNHRPQGAGYDIGAYECQ